jgi:hypothetical protein
MTRYGKPLRLTDKQRALLELLPSDRSRLGAYCHGARLRLARVLESEGLAERTMPGARGTALLGSS